MRRALASIVALGLLVPAVAAAKGGVIFDRYPDVQSVGAPMKFTVMIFREGARPVVTFRNKTTGELVRVRTTRTDLNGIAHGSVRLPSKGPWTQEITVAGRSVMPGDSEPFRVGVGLTETILSPAARDAFPWLWVLSLGSIGSALLVLVMRRRGRWGAI
ncbi:MAG: hypothetical protein QOJ29_822 [Thermoleophilaceae bacterium]|jgi:hypothetical protein|nr:hypothetical protein [Thermoleophilaceae bacterium]